MRDNQGNALFLILIAVALFAALSYAVTQSGRGGGNTDRETKSIQAAQIIQYVGAVQSAVQKLQLLSGCTDDGISFHHASWGHNDYLHAPVVPSDCRIYEDGGLTFETPNLAYFDPSQSARLFFGEYTYYERTCIYGVGTSAPSNCNISGLDDEDLMMFLMWIDRDLCIELNNKLGVTNPSGEPPADQQDSFTLTDSSYRYNGNFADANTIGEGGATEIYGQHSACFQGSALGSKPPQGTYHFYSVLISR